VEDLVLALVARRYYLEDRSKVQIADEIGVSRFRVARLLEQARDRGIVRIEVDAPPGVDLDASRRLADRFGLRQALVLAGVEGDSVRTRTELGRACTSLLSERLTSSDVLGVSWGRTLHALAGVLTPLPACEVVQMVGTVPAVDLDLGSMDLVRRFGQATGGPVHALHAPLALDTPELARALRESDFVRATTRRFPDITCALVGIGSWDRGGSSLRSALPPRVATLAAEAGAAADLCATVLDESGGTLTTPAVADWCISITTEQLRQVPQVIAVAGGAEKATAIAAAARAGLVHTLVTDHAAAEVLLDGAHL
jgi:DNA-binding transcriptional regulator LsrR (DeoR family)